MILVAAGVLVGSSQALATTGAITKKCQTAWVGNPTPSKACAILWWDESTQEISARCTVEYGFSGVSTNIIDCELDEGTGNSFERVVTAIAPGIVDTSVAKQTYTFATVSNAVNGTHTYAVKFEFQPGQGSISGDVVTIVTKFKSALPVVTGVSPNTGSKAGGTVVTVTGLGFALGTTGTTFKFGTTLGTNVNCTSATKCTVTAPPHAVGKVDVKATVGKLTSKANKPADQFTYA